MCLGGEGNFHIFPALSDRDLVDLVPPGHHPYGNEGLAQGWIPVGDLEDGLDPRLFVQCVPKLRGTGNGEVPKPLSLLLVRK